jgi:amino acid adenylation domain-containing protein
VHTGTSNNDLTLTILSEHAAWECNLEYASDLFTEDAVANLAESFLEILRAIVADPDETIDRLSMVSQAERHRLLVEWNATAKDYPLDQCVHELIEAQALRTPERIAVTSGKAMLTYRELNAKANQLAVQLRELGVVRRDCVPVMMGQSLELAISELAVMKCGGAFVPLDPHWPKERIRAVLSEINPRVIVAGAPQLPDGWPLITVVAQNLTGQDQNVNAACDPSDPLYVIFTSGSTGKPKGAINQHVGIVNRFHNMTDRFGCHEDDRILATTAPYYDSAVWQLFWPLVNGAGTVLPPADADLNEILELIAAEKITITDFVPSLFNVLASQLADAPQIRSKLRSVRQLIVGGEEISPDRVFQFKEYFPEIGITNAYGPTETSIGVIFYDIPNEPCSRIPIGKPLYNVRAVIVDRRFALVPTGVSGELCLGGVCVGLGYLNAQEATEAVFVDNPFTELDCGKLYRTGDLARHLPDGNIEYLGRIDSQVKIRGHRIELGEIEKTIRSQPGITAAVAVVRDYEPGEKRLFAFLVAETGVRLEGPELRARLAEKLPHYMIPARFMVISELPLTANGKVDRKAMAAMEAEELPTLAAYVPPRTELEQTLVEIWEALLSRPQISRYDNFFDLGGHSLLALKFISTLRELTGIILPVRMVFESPTPAALAEHLVHLSVANGMGASMEKAAELPMIPEMHPDAARDSPTSINDILARQRVYSRTWKGRRLYPESFIVTHNEAGSRQGIFWCLSSYRAFSQLAKHLGADQPVHGMRSGSYIMNYTEENLRAIANYYAGEMTDLQPEGAFLIGGNCQGGRIAHSIAERLLELGRSVTLLILLEHITHLPHGSPVALFFGSESDFNPYTNGKDPEMDFRLAYPAGYTVDIIGGDHGQLFESPHVEFLAAALISRLPIQHDEAPSGVLRAGK